MLARGQLQALQGVPSPWPTDVPPALAPEAFRARLEELGELGDDVELATVDCNEYPCVAAIRYTGPGEADRSGTTGCGTASAAG